jgi:hypothetical protein
MTYRELNEAKTTLDFYWYDVFEGNPGDVPKVPSGHVEEPRWIPDPPMDSDGDGTPDDYDADPNDPNVQ